jgi:hypothetical protein
MISAVSEPNEKKSAAFTVSAMAICIAAIFSVPSGREPRKLINRPVKKIRTSFCISRCFISKIPFLRFSNTDLN